MSLYSSASDSGNPCPFCGCKKLLVKDDPIHYVTCCHCDCDGPGADSRERAIELWNARALPAALTS